MPSVHFSPTFFVKTELKCLHFSGLYSLNKKRNEEELHYKDRERYLYLRHYDFSQSFTGQCYLHSWLSRIHRKSYPFSMLGFLDGPRKPILCFHGPFFSKALHVDDDFRQKCKPPSLDRAFLPLPRLTFPENFWFYILQVTVDAWPASKGRDHAVGIHVLDSAHPEGFLLEGVTILDGDFPVEGRAHLMR